MCIRDSVNPVVMSLMSTSIIIPQYLEDVKLNRFSRYPNMQKFINVVALLSGLTSLALIAGSGYVLMNEGKWRAEAQERLKGIIVDGIQDALPGLLDSAVPEALPTPPSMTGGAIPLP